MSKKFSLINATDEHMTRKLFSLPRGSHHYPSEASVKWTDRYGIERVAGQCLRAAWLRATGKGIPASFDAYTQWIFSLGKAVEEILVEQWKQMGIWVANNVKFYDKEKNISGELDVVVRDTEGKLVCCEIKSFSGYNATKEIMGNKSVAGHPKTSQLLQCLIYVDLCQKLGILDYAKLVYYSRDSALRREFDVVLIDEGDTKRPVIDGAIDYRFTMKDIYKRYEELDEYIKNDIMPPRDYEMIYPKEKILKLNSVGEIAKTKFADWQKNPEKNPIGSWHCSYCGFKSFCSNNS